MNTTIDSVRLAVKTTELTRRFGDMTAVDHVDLEMPSGGIFGLLGSNGAGKSTMIKMLTTLLPPTSGTAEVDGFDIITHPAEIRGRIGYVPQLLSADGALTGYENLLLSAKLYGLPRPERSARIGEALTLMGLTDSARKLVKTYSGGMIRRLELAQAMLHRPAILFLDEPTIGLDPVARHTVWDRLQDLRHMRGIYTGEVGYLAFITPGILAQSVLFSAIFYGIAVIWERDLGVVHKLLVSPARRSSLVFGKAVSAGFRGVVQAVVIYLVALVMHIPIRHELRAIFGVLALVLLGSGLFSTFSLIIACIVKTRERFMGIGQLLTMPLFFASNAIYPLELMPRWLRIVAQVNPLTYLVDALRALMIVGGESVHGYRADFAVLFAVFGVLLMVAVRLYPTLVE